MNPTKVLLVDDDKRYADPLIDRAWEEHSIDMEYCEDWEEGLSRIQADPKKYAAIILDGKGKLRRGAKGDDPLHLSQALADLSAMMGEGKLIPFVINTAYYDELVAYFGDKDMVDKKDTNELFKLLKRVIQSSDVEKIKNKYKEAFEPFVAGYLGKDAEENLIEVLLEFESNRWTSNSLTPLRKIIESVYIKLHEFDDQLIPYGCLRFTGGKINFKFCELRLTGRDIRENASGRVIYEAIDTVVPTHIGMLLGPITTICHISSHAQQKTHFTKYSFGTIINGVIDLLIWYKHFIDEN